MSTDFAKKILTGQLPSAEDWNAFLQDAHHRAPSMTPSAFAPYRTIEGLTSYEVLSRSVERLRGSSATILDLACGDGYLIPHLLTLLGSSGHIIGLDMTDAELEIAQKRLTAEERVTLLKGMAQSIPLDDASLDAVVCHLAFMLFLPLDPVVDELRRTLKSGGIFSAVVSNNRNKSGFFAEIQKTAAPLLQDRYPKIREAPAGDVRVRSEAGIRDLFKVGFDPHIDFTDFSIRIDLTPDSAWNLMRDMYFVSMLPESEKRDLEKAL